MSSQVCGGAKFISLALWKTGIALALAFLLTAMGCGGGSGGSGAGNADQDEDGLTDDEERLGWEVSVVLNGGEILTVNVTSDRSKSDTDEDGLFDATERDLGTDPRSSDTDGDEISDYDEWTRWFTDPRAQDSDEDGLTDGQEVLFLKTSPVSADTDGDGFTDDEELLELSRDPRIADLPRPRIDVGDVALRLDTRFTFTDQQGTSRTTEESTGATLAKSKDERFSQSDSSTTKHTFETKLKIGSEFSISKKAIGATFSRELELGYAFADERTVGFEEEVSESAQQAYQESLTTFETVDETKQVTREVVGASIEVPVTIANVSDTAFRLTNLEVTALLQDPVERTRFLPVGTLVPATALDTGMIPEVTTGPFLPERGPFVFRTRDVFPSLVEDLLRAPRGLIFQVVNFDMTSETGRNFAFVSQEVNDRTAGITIDFGDRSEHYRVSTNSSFDENGKPRGITLGYALQDILGFAKNSPPDAITVGKNGCGETFARGDDVQVAIPACPPVRADGVVVSAGPNGLIDSIPRGDDLIVQDCGNGECIEVVRDGGDGCAQTRAFGDDVQSSGECDARSITPGTPCTADDVCRNEEYPDGSCVGICARGGPDGEFVRAGPNARLDSSPAGDDEVATIGGYATQIVGICDADSKQAGLACETDVECRDDQHRDGICKATEALTRVRSLMTRPNERRAWWLLASADIDLGANFDEIHLQAGDRVSLAFVEDKDDDGLFSREEFIHGSSDEDTDTDDDGIGDFDEVQIGWEVSVEGLRPYTAFSHPGRPDSESDGLPDREELLNGTDPRKSDTDGDGISDFEEIFGFAVVDIRRNKALSVVLPYAGEFPATLQAICDGGDGVADTAATADDKQVVAFESVGPRFGVVVLPGENGTLDTMQPGGDDRLCEADCVGSCAVHRGTFATNPLNRDTDADGLPDGIERAVGANPNDASDATRFRDDDFDGLTNAEEASGWVVLLESVQQDAAGETIAFFCLDDQPLGACDSNDLPCLDNGDCGPFGRCLTGACDNEGDLRCANDGDCIDLFHPFARCIEPQVRLFVCEQPACSENSHVCSASGMCDSGVCESSGRCEASGRCTRSVDGGSERPPCTTNDECTAYPVDGQSVDLGTCDSIVSCSTDAECDSAPCVNRQACNAPLDCTAVSGQPTCVAVSCTSDDDCGSDLGRCDGLATCASPLDCAGLCELSGVCQGSGICALSGACEASGTCESSGLCEGSGVCDGSGRCSEDSAVPCTSDDDCVETCLDPSPCTNADQCVAGSACVGAAPCTGAAQCSGGVSCLGTKACATDEQCAGSTCLGAHSCTTDDQCGGAQCLSTDPCSTDEECGGALCSHADPCSTDDECLDGLCVGAETCTAAEECNAGDCVLRAPCADVSGRGCHMGSCGAGLCVTEQGIESCTNDDDCDYACTQPSRCRRSTSDPLEPDSDFDGLPDLLESMLASNPLSADTDNDRLLDFDELDPGSASSIPAFVFRTFTGLCVDAPRCSYDPQGSELYGSSVVNRDTDGDGLDDYDEVFDTWIVRVPTREPFLAHSDPLFADRDLDGSMDSTERSENTDPTDPDTDDDGLLDGEDPTPDGRPGLATLTFETWTLGSNGCDGGSEPGEYLWELGVDWKCDTTEDGVQFVSPSAESLRAGASFTFGRSKKFVAEVGCTVAVEIRITETDGFLRGGPERFVYSNARSPHTIEGLMLRRVSIPQDVPTDTIQERDSCFRDDTITYTLKFESANVPAGD